MPADTRPQYQLVWKDGAHGRAEAGVDRPAILTVLSSVRAGDFVLLPRGTGLSKGHLSGHLTKLEAAGW